MQATQRDLSSPELWEDSLERSRRRRVLAAQGRREMNRKKQASAAVSAAMVMTQTAPAFAAALSGGGAGTRSKVAQSSPANRAIAPAAPGVMLRFGSTGPDVARVQSTLGIATDGIFGPQTDAAVRAFQQKAGLSPDGIVGAATWRALFGSGTTTGASFKGSPAPRFGFTIQRASKTEAAHVRPALAGKGEVAKVVVRTIP